ncbi:hypothetical protein WL80_17035 [Burkholderia ubonensis]|nr:hypothetical protein WL80_17035 [Burkholderia ubonensis]
MLAWSVERIGDGIEFSTLEQAISAARKGAGLVVADLDMIGEERVAVEHVRAFAAWLREQVAGTGEDARTGRSWDWMAARR